jgi:hypothetical protein
MGFISLYFIFVQAYMIERIDTLYAITRKNEMTTTKTLNYKSTLALLNGHNGVKKLLILKYHMEGEPLPSLIKRFDFKSPDKSTLYTSTGASRVLIRLMGAIYADCFDAGKRIPMTDFSLLEHRAVYLPHINAILELPQIQAMLVKG